MLLTSPQPNPHQRSHPQFLGQWIAATALAGAIVGALEAGGFQFLATIFLSGFVVGMGQWFILRRLIPKASRWIIASSVGWILGTYTQVELGQVFDPLIRALTELGGWEVLWLNVINLAVTATLFGLAQWLVLRLLIAQAHRWIITSCLAGAIAGAVGASVCFFACQPITFAAGGVITGAIVNGLAWGAYGTLTGLLLERLLRPNL
ncbi:MAG: hypothetical protein SFY66_19435 [Oculatellaceae cyanobacterium bins.114]|nr:hypothetical protein [Oculatellaceae cyanobacterium bins.114]